MNIHTTTSKFNIRQMIVAAAAAIAIPVLGLVGAQSAAAEPVQPTAPKASCTWNGQTTSDGGYHTETSGSSWAKYKCVDGTWVKESSCDGNCNPPPPKTNPTTPKGGVFTLPSGAVQVASR